MTKERGKFGKVVFKFTLNRIIEQPRTSVALKDNNMDGDNSSIASFRPRKRHNYKVSALQKNIVRERKICYLGGGITRLCSDTSSL